MKTRISDFCRELRDTLVPLADRARDTAACLSRHSEPALQALHGRISTTRDGLDALIRKVEEQEVYVLIFGPIKSGKSTLMNAICRSYVSEVTALPAYPCMVYVRHGDQPRFSLTRYTEETEQLDGPDALQSALAHGHQILADRVREFEDRDETFDPAVHLPDAIRRVDIQLPIDHLRASGAVLVDTPGLYTRMKFGYDIMTQQFRHSAASAVFVVKADNLFLEQVFDDFNDLLELFSRIFVVVNIDATKRDLRPDGELAQSLESRDPQAVISAFTSLTMSAALRHAAESGRIRIYPVDLLHAAARRLGHPDPDHDAHGDRFEIFVDDLTAYLNSTDQAVEFMVDALRRAEALRDDLQTEDIRAVRAEIRTRHQTTAGHRADIDRRRFALERTRAVDWATCLAPTRHRLRRARRQLAADLEQRFQSDAAAALTAWMASDEGLNPLREQHWGAALRNATAEFQQTVRRDRSRLGEALADATLPGGVDKDLSALGFDAAGAAAQAVGDAPATESPELAIAIDPAALPLRRTLWDLLFFRGPRTIRRQGFGSSPDPDRPIPARWKRRRLGVAAKDRLLKAAHDGAAIWFDELLTAAERQEPDAVGRIVSHLARRLETLDQGLSQEQDASRTQETSAREMEDRLNQLFHAAAEAEPELVRLGKTIRPAGREPGVGGRIDLAALASSTD